jgi:hypothetical protein
MREAMDPMLLFPVVAALSAGLALALWRRNRGVAVMSAVLSMFSALLILGERAARAAHANIRVDLLVTIPAVSAAALVIGLLAVRRPPSAARVCAAGLAIVGGLSTASFAWFTVRTGIEGAHITRTFEEGYRLYWEETIRCQGNLATRFGAMDRAGEPCRGNLVVASRSAGSYPFSRAILNDAGEFYLLFSPAGGEERVWGLDSIDSDRAAARLATASNGVLSGDGVKNGQPVHVELRSTGAGQCKAKVVRGGRTEEFDLTQAGVPPCAVPSNPPVRFVGAWGAAAPQPNSPQTKRLAQIWLWDTDGTARGLFVGTLATTGTNVPFLFARRLEGTRRAENAWDLRVADGDGVQNSQAFTFTLAGGHARAAGSSMMFGPTGEMLLDPQEIVSHPRIALAPVSDRDRFARYFDNVFFNLNLPWTVK